MQKRDKSVHKLAAINISKVWAQEAKNRDLKHRVTVISVIDKVMEFSAWAAQRKRDKLAHRWLGPYTIVEVNKNGN